MKLIARCFEVATQFLAIFSSATSKNYLRMWVMRRIQSYLQLLSKTALITDFNVLANVWEAAIFFASCMAKSLQCNFAPLLPSSLDPHLIRILREKWSTQKLQETLQLSREHSLPNLLTNTLFSPTTLPEEEKVKEEDEGLHPPKSLLLWPPLARWINSYLNGLNDLKRCLVPSAFQKIRSLHHQRKEEISKLLSSHLLQCKQACVSSTLANNSEQMIQIYNSVVVPYMDNALEYALGTILPPPPPKEQNEQAGKNDHDEVPDLKDEETDQIEETVKDEIKTDEVEKELKVDEAQDPQADSGQEETINTAQT